MERLKWGNNMKKNEPEHPFKLQESYFVCTMAPGQAFLESVGIGMVSSYFGSPLQLRLFFSPFLLHINATENFSAFSCSLPLAGMMDEQTNDQLIN